MSPFLRHTCICRGCGRGLLKYTTVLVFCVYLNPPSKFIIQEQAPNAANKSLFIELETLFKKKRRKNKFNRVCGSVYRLCYYNLVPSAFIGFVINMNFHKMPVSHANDHAS